MDNNSEKREVKKIALTPRPDASAGGPGENREGDSRRKITLSDRGDRGGYGNRSDRGGPRSFNSGGDRPQRDFNRAPGRDFNRDNSRSDDRGERNFNRDGADRSAPRPFNREGGDRPYRDFNRAPGRDFNRDNSRSDDRGERNFNRDGADRSAPRSFNSGGDRPFRDFNRAPGRDFNRDDRGGAPRDFNRDFNRDDRVSAPRSFTRDFNRDERPSAPRNEGDKPRRKRITSEGGGSYERLDPTKRISREGGFDRGSRERTGPLQIRKGILSKKVEIPNYPDVVLDKPLRLNKYISNTGLCSRREADEYIQAGKISVNGTVVTEMGVKVNPNDEVAFDGRVLSRERKIYLILNKPKGFVTSLDDPESRKTVMELVNNACKERIYPVGRLDKMTTGVLLFTNDGELALKLTHPANHMRKVYHVQLDRPIPAEDLEKLTAGVELEDGMITPDAVAYAHEDDFSQVGVEIHSGRNRVVRRMFDQIGYKVSKLDRVYFSGLSKKGLKRGKWRFLTPQEVSFLKMMPTGV